jgi:hypothetical protein
MSLFAAFFLTALSSALLAYTSGRSGNHIIAAACGRRVAVWRDYRADWCADLVTPRRYPLPWSVEETDSRLQRQASATNL